MLKLLRQNNIYSFTKGCAVSRSTWINFKTIFSLGPRNMYISFEINTFYLQPRLFCLLWKRLPTTIILSLELHRIHAKLYAVFHVNICHRLEAIGLSLVRGHQVRRKLSISIFATIDRKQADEST